MSLNTNDRRLRFAPDGIRWLLVLMGIIGAVYRVMERSVGPVAGLLIRLWLAKVFFVSGILKIFDLSIAPYLSNAAYPVPWVEPLSPTYLGAAIQMLIPVLLALGLATRWAALYMLILVLVVQFNYLALDINLYSAVLFGWFVICGAGPLSLDHLLARGLGDTALPFATALTRLAGAVTQYLKSYYQLVVRLWLGLALLVVSLGAAIPVGLAKLIPEKSLAHFAPTPTMALVCALLLAFGFVARPAALVLIMAVAGMHIVGAVGPADVYFVMTLALVALYGPGNLSLDRLILSVLPQISGRQIFSLEGAPHVVIVGAGFGGLTCAAKLTKTPVQVTLIDRHNYHLFQPLLYQVATASLSPADIAATVRGLFSDYFNVRVLLGQVTGVDTVQQEVLIGKRRVPYDYLVLATGASHSYFGRDDWEPHAQGLKTIDDAEEVRRRVLSAFERAEAAEDPADLQSLLTFVIVGGGPTGVELAGAVAELARYGMEKEFHYFDPASARVVLVQSAPRLLPTFPETLSEKAKRSLERLGVKVMLESRVEHIDQEGVRINGERLASRTVLWAAGVVASPAARWLHAAADRSGRVKVEADLSVTGLPNVFVIGDTALANAWKGKPVPGLAPAAKQGGAYVARTIRRKLQGQPAQPPFAYHHMGSLATIGRKAAVASFNGVNVSGAPAWWLWGLIHVALLVGLRNRISVMFNWFWAYLTFKRGTRLITGDKGPLKGGINPT
ncbi:FAD-dependent pyridine nucleotide-disulfide oxidoreductase [Acidithiobacillus ferrivorans]|uniref:NADH:ubiquinone reductase (non-electrogenic) n=1 Tax=Acidithiobacillus ferrivorans TaxID=160808 RepID=A0A060UW73_9PROT|nr:FAD-dependent oxidoreductase [Acidithiobacillus ferrivorans]CDQ10978.1 FAD-dependent pyridine nucleotide-disulfide oxidoreductase [Acidithiobacillus ferrivorans]SMH65784.1 FAD-dependent pyridine nucleotide-disulfide oxidoreductase [Acidithiobacillus ferrivorans]